jgi:hypothetical protein
VVQKAKGRGLLKEIRRSELWDKLSPLVPRRIRAVGTRMAESSVDIREVDVREVVDYLRPFQQEQTEELSELVGRSFPVWKTLHGEA